MGLVIPSTFTAIDRFTGPVGRMAGAMNRFVGVSESGIARQERMFRRFTPVISEAGKQLVSMAGAAAIVGGILATANFSSDQIVAYENNLASFRTIVSDLSEKDFAKYREEIFKVGNDTKRSSVMVAEAFEKVAGLNATFAETSKGLGEVSTAAIILSKASKDELGTSAESLVGIMNQFSLGADQANRTINVLAAGQAVGAASITQSAEAYKNFGSVAASANITLEQSQGLIQTLGKFSLFGAEAGTKLRGSVLQLQKAGLGYKTGQFRINDALREANRRIEKLSTAKAKDAALTKLFGAENISTGRILLANVDVYKKFTEGVTGTSEAQKAAEINSNTLSNRVEELKAKWVNMITGADAASSSLESVKGAVVFVTDNLGTLLNLGGKVLIFFLAWKVLITSMKIALLTYNVVLGVSIALQKASTLTIGKNSVAISAYNIVTKAAAIATGIWTAATKLLGYAFKATPIGWIVLGVTALIAAITWVASKTTGWGETWDSVMKWMGALLDLFVAGIKLQWQIVANAFQTMVDSIVLAWKWGQNKMGNLSDEQYAKDIARIKGEQAARMAAIHQTEAEGARAMQTLKAGIDWQIKWKPEEEAKGTDGAKALTPLRVQGMLPDGDSKRNQPATKDKLEVTIKAPAGTVDGIKNPGGIPIKVSKTFDWMNK